MSVHLFHELLFCWYSKQKRDLPWRRELVNRKQRTESRVIRDPYRILVSELMLQQTQVSRVVPKFVHFIERWPTIESLSQAKLSEVITQWKGLGYNRRAKHLLETAKLIVAMKSFPTEKKDLLKLPGFGPYMVSALRVFAFGFQEPVLDVNVRRIQERTGLEPIAIPKNKADQWHQALMDFGSSICTAKSPKCVSCPVSRICRANKKAKQEGFADFSVWLSLQPKVKKGSKKDLGKKFEETDRYFRGRIIDFLRDGKKPMEEVQEHIVVIHKLGDRARFGRIIESLVIDGLIAVHRNDVSLA